MQNLLQNIAERLTISYLKLLKFRITKITGGIITDEDGILFHAALINREMDKPCLIGVHNATQILKEGGNIVLDAFTGVVRVVHA